MKNLLLGLSLSVVMLHGCCSIINGPSQEVSVGSSPSGAKVFHNGMQVGTTPAILDLKRKNSHTIRVEKDGYHPYEAALTRKTSGWVWGNLFFGGLIGLFVDATSGSYYNLNPESMQPALLPITVVSPETPFASTPRISDDVVRIASATNAPVQSTANMSVPERMRSLKALLDEGLLTNEEYEARRKPLIDSL